MSGMWRYLCVFVVVAAVAAGAGCDWIGGGSAAPRQRSIDELAGSYRGVGLGDPRSAAIHVFGRPDSTGNPAHPSNADGWPISLQNPPGYLEKPDFTNYDGVTFLSTPTAAGIHSSVVTDPRAATTRGVGIGDALSDARQAYPTLHCAKARSMSENETAPPFCAGRLARNRYIWFGNDPIRVIALSPTSMG